MGKNSKKQPAIARKLKVRLWRHLGERCFYCGEHVTMEKVTVDHVFPRVEGYSSINNVIPSCKPCNEAKDDAMPDIDLLIRVQALYDDAGELFDPFRPGHMGESVLSFWGRHCHQNRDPRQSEKG